MCLKIMLLKLPPHLPGTSVLTHWGRVTHICVGKLTNIGSDHGLSPGRRQAIIWTNAGVLLLRPLGTNFSEILIKIHTFSFKKMHLKMSSGKWRPFCLGLNVLSMLLTPQCMCPLAGRPVQYGGTGHTQHLTSLTLGAVTFRLGLFTILTHTHGFRTLKCGTCKQVKTGMIHPGLCRGCVLAVYDFKYFKGLPFGLYKFEDL